MQIQGGRLKTAYANREGTYPIHVAAPLSTMEPVSGTIEVQVVVIDFGKPVEATASYAGHAMPLHVASHDEPWSTWRGKLDTALACDGERTLQVASRLGQETSRAEIRYLVLNGRKESYQADAPATLKIEFSEVDAADEILLNGKRLGNLKKAAGRTMQWRLAHEQLGKVNRVTILRGSRAGGEFGWFPGGASLVRVPGQDNLRPALFLSRPPPVWRRPGRGARDRLVFLPAVNKSTCCLEI